MFKYIVSFVLLLSLFGCDMTKSTILCSQSGEILIKDWANVDNSKEFSQTCKNNEDGTISILLLKKQ